MKLQYAIPVFGISTTLSACADPIVGDWSVNSITSDGETMEIPYSYGGTELISSITMSVAADLTGTFVSEGYSGDYMDMNNTTNLTATNDGGGDYTITPSGEEMGVLSCTLSGSTMDCTDPADGTVLAMTKGAKE